MTRIRNRDAGFTLVEVLIALALAGALAAMLYQGLRLGHRAWTALSARAAAVDEIGVAHRLIRQVIDQAYPLPAPTALGFEVDFRGEARGVLFWTPPPDIWAYPGGLIQARLQIRERDGRRDLVLALSESLDDATRTEEISLLRDIADLTIAYYGQAGREGRWNASWRNRPTLPQLIRLRVSFAEGDRRVWPELVVAPKIDLDTECVIDPLTLRCRGR
jgi:general secretion pathway protein J